MRAKLTRATNQMIFCALLQVEDYLEDVDAPYTVFQPQYMYGPYNAKDCEQWFLDRIVRGRPVCVPEPGAQDAWQNAVAASLFGVLSH
jgi:hypothetical protein